MGRKSRAKRERRSLTHNPPPQRTAEQDAAVAERLFQIEYHSGPLPDPRTLWGYDQLVSDGAERVFRQFELQAKTRRRSESLRAWGEWAQRVLNPVYAIVIFAATIAAGIWALVNGYELAGLAAILAPAATIAVAFFRETRNREKKAQTELDLG